MPDITIPDINNHSEQPIITTPDNPINENNTSSNNPNIAPNYIPIGPPANHSRPYIQLARIPNN